MGLLHPFALFVVSLPISSPAPLLPCTPELPFQLMLGGSLNAELFSCPIHFFWAPAMCQTLESHANTWKTWSCPKCKNRGIRRIAQVSMPMYTPHTAVYGEEVLEKSHKVPKKSWKKFIYFCRGMGTAGEKLGGNLGRLPRGGDI